MKFVPRDPNTGYLDANLWIPKNRVNIEGVKNALSFSIQEHGEEGTLFLYKEAPNHIITPREFWAEQPLDFEIVDCRPQHYEEVHIKSRIQLDMKDSSKTVQRESVQKLLDARGGVLQLACGIGKTVIAIETMSRLHVPCIIAVDTTILFEQWKAEILKHLCINEDQIGLYQGKNNDWQKPIVLATYQTLSQRADKLPEEFRRYFGAFFGDEGHHGNAPLFSRCANLFYGRRYFLTATPFREDGMHVICALHIGPVLHKDLTQELKPNIVFKWTGFELNLNNPDVVADTHDSTGELHLGKLSSHFGQWMERLHYIVDMAKTLQAQGRKILVLSNSVAELVNLYHVWNGRTDPMFHEIPIPTCEELGERPHDSPTTLDPTRQGKLLGRVRELQAAYNISNDEAEKDKIARARDRYQEQLRGHYIAIKMIAEMNKRQKQYILSLLTAPSDAGIMTQHAGVKNRSEAIKRQVTFAITKYGREGLDAPALDTVITCEPISSQNNIQQFMGRVLRVRPGKQAPLVIFLEDNIGLIIGMCRKVRNHLKYWPAEDGGPYKFSMEGYPRQIRP